MERTQELLLIRTTGAFCYFYSQARQASSDRAWFGISRFYENCKNKKPGKKGYPQFQHNNRSVEYKKTGWKLDDDGRHITFTDGCGIGRLRLVGNKKQTQDCWNRIVDAACLGV